MPYSFYGSLTSFSDDKDLMDFLKKSFYNEKECEEWIESQKKQKPVEHLNDEKKIIKEISDFIYEASNGIYRTIEKETFEKWLDYLQSFPLQYIDIDALTTDIEKKIKSIESCPFIEAEFGAMEKREGKIQAYKEILFIIDSLQQEYQKKFTNK